MGDNHDWIIPNISNVFPLLPWVIDWLAVFTLSLNESIVVDAVAVLLSNSVIFFAESTGIKFGSDVPFIVAFWSAFCSASGSAADTDLNNPNSNYYRDGGIDLINFINKIRKM